MFQNRREELDFRSDSKTSFCLRESIDVLGEIAYVSEEDLELHLCLEVHSLPCHFSVD